MLNLEIRDLFRPQVYIIRYGGKQVYKTSSLAKVKQMLKALKILNIKEYYVYKIVIRKEDL